MLLDTKECRNHLWLTNYVIHQGGIWEATGEIEMSSLLLTYPRELQNRLPHMRELGYIHSAGVPPFATIILL